MAESPQPGEVLKLVKQLMLDLRIWAGPNCPVCGHDLEEESHDTFCSVAELEALFEGEVWPKTLNQAKS